MVTTEQVRPVWKCRVEGCNYTAAPTVEGYRKISGHQLAHTGVPKAKRGFQLVDETTGEVLAQKLEEATAKGFIAAKPPEPTTPVPSPATETKQPEPDPEQPKPEPEVEPPEAEEETRLLSGASWRN